MEAISASVTEGSRWVRIKAALTPQEWRRAGGMAAVIAGLHVVGFGILILVVAPAKYELGSAGTFAIGTGITAYALGMRHAFDADHISAIDNVTRKLMSEGKRPLSVGFFFSLGHSTIVFGLAVLLAARPSLWMPRSARRSPWASLSTAAHSRRVGNPVTPGHSSMARP